MKECYIDSSVLGAYYTPEPLSEKAQAFLIGIDIPVISMLTEVEMASLIAKKIRVGDFGVRQARKILKEFRSHLEAGYFRKLMPSRGHYLRATDMLATFKTSLRSLDALHLAMASSESLPIVTADTTLRQAAKYLDLPVRFLKT